MSHMYSVPQTPSMDRLVGEKVSPTMHSSDKTFPFGTCASLPEGFQKLS